MALNMIERTKSGVANFISLEISSELQTPLAENDNREDIIIFNDSNRSLLVSFSDTVSEDEFSFKILPGGYYEAGISAYTGDIHTLWVDGDGEPTGKALITELEG